MIRETKDLFTFKCWRALTIASYDFAAKYKAITLSCLYSITNNFFSKCNSSKCFCKLINIENNKTTCHWNKSVSCQASGLQPEVGCNTYQSPCIHTIRFTFYRNFVELNAHTIFAYFFLLCVCITDICTSVIYVGRTEEFPPLSETILCIWTISCHL